jgi:hypothetical protein
MVVLMEDIMLEIELHKRFYNQVFIGLSFLKMLESLFYPPILSPSSWIFVELTLVTVIGFDDNHVLSTFNQSPRQKH